MSFPWSYSILGLVPGSVTPKLQLAPYLRRKTDTHTCRLILTVFVAGVVLYT